MTTPSGVVTANDVPALSPQDLTDVAGTATKALKTLDTDRNRANGLLQIQRYLNGEHPGPYIPTQADQEYRFLAKRAMDNWIPTALKAPSQALYVEGHHLTGSTDRSPAWACWQRNRLDGRQTGLYRDALAYGESFVWIQKADAKLYPTLAGFGKATLWTRLTTVGLYEDIVNDARPAFVVHVKSWATNSTVGTATAVDRDNVYEITFDDQWVVTVASTMKHGFADCPVIAFVPHRDLEGNPQSILVPLFPVQDRINQTTFDRLIIQQYGAFKVRYITGMTPPPQRVQVPVTVATAMAEGTIDEDDPRYAGADPGMIIGSRSEVVVDTATGEPVPQNVTTSASRLLVLADDQASVGQLDETPLAGILAAGNDDVHRFAAQAQLPPYWLGVDLANLSADALAVAASAMAAAIAEFQHSFGESWEQVMQLFAEAEGLQGADDYDSEMIWRDMSARSMGQVVDALGKASSQLGIPGEALWGRIPNTTAEEVNGWKKIAADQQVNQANANDVKGNVTRNVSSANAKYLQALQGGGTPTKPVTDATAPVVPNAVA